MSKQIEIEIVDGAGEVVEMLVSAVWEICDECSGEGHVDNPAFSNGISGEEWNHEWDEESREAYLSGAYDVRCDKCKGSGKFLAPNLDELSDEERAGYEKRQQDEADYQWLRAQERRYGC